ncbi:hypothetical protein [Hansschlegelia sp.]|uniref:hypothetical protein n=1 Tax=Hansschlegelia sp. TaxID=2041892 RepID=UPI002C583980|nr:hypothetical protein [Hansschlegelia sp.]HVI28882.1 hypothetical protein [Hansschlegelia sp.]
MQAEWSYWVYATLNSMLLLTCALSCALFAFWSWELRRSPRTDLWAILPLTVWTHAAIAMIPLRWIWPRALDPAYAVSMIIAVNAAQSFDSYALTQALLLIAVMAKVALVWIVRGSRTSLLVAVFCWLTVLSICATRFHAEQMAAFCRDDPGSCEPP